MPATLTAREARTVEALAEAVVRPDGLLPPVSGTDTVAAVEAQLAAGPPVNRAAIRALLALLEAAPLALGPRRRRLSALAPGEREDVLKRLARSPGRPALDALQAMLKLCYFGDPGVMRGLGFDADALVARGRALRVAEDRW
jgi:hypothetical protein